MKTKVFALIIIVLMQGLAVAQSHTDAYEKTAFIKHQDTLLYRILYPKDFDANKQYPMVLFLHGAGERGSDNEAQLIHGSTVFATAEAQKEFPAIVVFPQCPKESYWSNATVDRSSMPVKLVFPEDAEPTIPMSLTMKLVDSITSQKFIKKDQVYVAGLSMGGMGTFEILSRKPETFAAAIAICGGGNPKLTERYAKTTSMWIIHGAQDNVVDPQRSLEMVEGLLEHGAYPRFTLYENANHNSWDPAFAEPDFLSWLFSHSLKTNQK